MKAAVVDRYGPPEVVQIREVPKPAPGPGEILVRITATTVNSGDARMRAARVPRGMKTMFRLAMGWNGPRKPVGGFEAAGVVEAVGAGVTKFKPGDRVTGSHGFKFGLHAEFALFAQTDALVATPAGLSDTDAVSVLFGGSTARYFFAAGGLTAGQKVLINGASGAVGVMAIQLAKRAGAHVTAVCSAANESFVRELGADVVIAYDREDFAAQPERYDIIMDNHGNAPFARVRHLLVPGGRFLQVIGDLGEMIAGKFTRQVVGSGKDSDMVSAAVYGELLDLTARGALRPVIDTVLPFARIAEAHARVDSGRKRGSVVVTLP
jgi:NADPH:quinone reductase-like Zn-dependent oxidoreductase